MRYRDSKINGPARCMLAQGYLVKKRLVDQDADIANIRHKTQLDKQAIKQLDAENARIAKDIADARKIGECVAVLKEYKKKDAAAFEALHVNRKNLCEKAEAVKRSASSN